VQYSEQCTVQCAVRSLGPPSAAAPSGRHPATRPPQTLPGNAPTPSTAPPAAPSPPRPTLPQQCSVPCTVGKKSRGRSPLHSSSAASPWRDTLAHPVPPCPPPHTLPARLLGSPSSAGGALRCRRPEECRGQKDGPGGAWWPEPPPAPPPPPPFPAPLFPASRPLGSSRPTGLTSPPPPGRSPRQIPYVTKDTNSRQPSLSCFVHYLNFSGKV
jgi:hypothetical protein